MKIIKIGNMYYNVENITYIKDLKIVYEWEEQNKHDKEEISKLPTLAQFKTKYSKDCKTAILEIDGVTLTCQNFELTFNSEGKSTYEVTKSREIVFNKFVEEAYKLIDWFKRNEER